MPRTTKLLTTIMLTGLIGLAGVPAAIAQTGAQMDETQTEEYAAPVAELATPSEADYFTAADLDNDGALSRDEFTLLTNTMADSGDSDAAAIRDANSYDDSFTGKDMDNDGVLSLGELTDSSVEIITPEDSETQ